MSTKTSITGDLQKLQEHAESIRNDEHAVVSQDLGDNTRQGDIYVTRINRLPERRRPRSNRQLADGATQGSRHVLIGEGAELFDADPRDVIALIDEVVPGQELRDYMIGPVFRVPEEVTVTHPEHGDRSLVEPGCYAVTYQRSLTVDEREERARD